MVEVDLRWGQEDPAPYLVKVPRVPVVGERFVGPDRFGTFEVVSVTYVYGSGFYYEPTAIVVEARKVEA